MSAASCQASSARSHPPVPGHIASARAVPYFTWCQDSEARSVPATAALMEPQLGRAWPASSPCDRPGKVHPPLTRIILGSWQCCRGWPGRGRGLGRARPTGLAAAVPSSLGSHLQVPHVQSSQGPAGEGQPTPVPGRGLRASTSVELRTPPSPCQLAAAHGNTQGSAD